VNSAYGSYRDPCGFIFDYEGVLYRQINEEYRKDYEHLIESGLYHELTRERLLIPHEETALENINKVSSYKIIRPEVIPFISYPYEWSFSQIKDAALLTLAIQRKCLEFGMSLKDASLYNIQFIGNIPIFIDTLSFERHIPDRPWVAYRQFCQHFFATLCMMKFCDTRLAGLLKNHINGIPLDLASKILPISSRLNVSVLIHIHLHAKSQQLYAGKKTKVNSKKFSSAALHGLLDSLNGAIKKMEMPARKTEWNSYYDENNYTEESFLTKKTIVSEMIDRITPSTVLDLGANTGVFSRISSGKGIYTVSSDSDPAVVEDNYLQSRKECEANILPLVVDLVDPSPAIGWENSERSSFTSRNRVDMVLALALLHHLAISNNLPLSLLAKYFADACNYLVVEFVPKEDSQVQKLLATRKDIFTEYDRTSFEKEFSVYFTILYDQQVEGSHRNLYLMERKHT
jgi:ribosomal protein L11 methylase PrmA